MLHDDFLAISPDCTFLVVLMLWKLEKLVLLQSASLYNLPLYASTSLDLLNSWQWLNTVLWLSVMKLIALPVVVSRDTPKYCEYLYLEDSRYVPNDNEYSNLFAPSAEPVSLSVLKLSMKMFKA